MHNLQNVIVSGIVAATGAVVCLVSFLQQPAEAYLFPRTAASLLVVFALGNLYRALIGKSLPCDGMSLQKVRRILPGLLICLVYVFWAVEGLGLYTATVVAVFVLLSIYDASPHTSLWSWSTRVTITASFWAVLYGLFAKLLKVYTPPELLF